MTAGATRNNRVRHDVMTSIVDALPVAIVEIDFDGLVRFANRPFRDWFVGARRKLVGVPIATVAERFHSLLVGPIESAMAGTRSIREAQFPAPGGRIRDVRATCIPRRDANGVLVGVVVSALDVSDEKRRLSSERFLAQATEDLFATLEPEISLQTVADNAISYLADWFSVEILRDDGGLDPVAMSHRDPERLLIAGQLRRQYPPHAGLRRAVKNGVAEILDYVGPEQLRERAEDEVHLELMRRMDIGPTMVVPLVAHGTVLGAFELVRSQSSGRTFGPADLALAEELARRAALAIENARLFELTRRAVVAREQLLAIVCHDLRDPLGVIRARSELLKQRMEGDPGSPVGKTVEAIERATVRMDALVSALADATRLRSGRLSVQPQPCDVVALGREAIDGLIAAARAKDIELTFSAQGDRAMAMVDPERVLQMLGNLLDNAIKFTQSGGRVDLRIGMGKGTVDIAVIDNGPGIAREELAEIFDRYWQLAPGQRRSSGLGLYIARGIVEAHRGRISAESQLGHGTAFRVALPTGGDRLDDRDTSEWSR
jgi:signal transduction histidine kinase